MEDDDGYYHYAANFYEHYTYEESDAVKMITQADLERIFSRSKPIQAVWYQLERSEKGAMHWQCHFKLRRTFNKPTEWLRECLDIPEAGGNCHIRKCDNIEWSKAYCQKVRSRVAGPYHYTKVEIQKKIKKI